MRSIYFQVRLIVVTSVFWYFTIYSGNWIITGIPRNAAERIVCLNVKLIVVYIK